VITAEIMQRRMTCARIIKWDGREKKPQLMWRTLWVFV
jgi:hypothetical protein